MGKVMVRVLVFVMFLTHAVAAPAFLTLSTGLSRYTFFGGSSPTPKGAEADSIFSAEISKLFGSSTKSQETAGQKKTFGKTEGALVSLEDFTFKPSTAPSRGPSIAAPVAQATTPAALTAPPATPTSSPTAPPAISNPPPAAPPAVTTVTGNQPEEEPLDQALLSQVREQVTILEKELSSARDQLKKQNGEMSAALTTLKGSIVAKQNANTSTKQKALPPSPPQPPATPSAELLTLPPTPCVKYTRSFQINGGVPASLPVGYSIDQSRCGL
jgi:hypothetical protein